MGSVREDIARKLFFDFEDYEKGTIAEMCWREAPQARKDIWLKKADQILSLVCKRIEGAKLGFGDIANMRLNVHALYSPTRKLIEFGEQVSKAQVQAILDVISPTGGKIG